MIPFTLKQIFVTVIGGFTIFSIVFPRTRTGDL
jgi:hypothetical protein